MNYIPTLQLLEIAAVVSGVARGRKVEAPPQTRKNCN